MNAFLANLRKTIVEIVNERMAEWVRNPPGLNPWHRHGTVIADYVSGLPRIRFDGDDVASDRRYPHLSSYTPAANDRVYLVRSGNTWLIIGKIVAS